ncbi:hypothetical protein MAPG_01980 [Magnaporthiopsis poae ATCC 64411]|uniref:Uncharacterized protein n=1 Tax=Magnaporthiopsis poae (strain ATCC 64411 / 73-15) TaxID=644358 RepID=A0A0C4DQ42_MAGP6|nr:hypothetical protein MAPG_01980 [Magnaporthiopsis poae ATCC 64411]
MGDGMGLIHPKGAPPKGNVEPNKDEGLQIERRWTHCAGTKESLPSKGSSFYSISTLGSHSGMSLFHRGGWANESGDGRMSAEVPDRGTDMIFLHGTDGARPRRTAKRRAQLSMGQKKKPSLPWLSGLGPGRTPALGC